jgi:hypothetical protein
MGTVKLGSLASLPLAVVLCILFFMPWVELSCSFGTAAMKLGTASGLQLVTGDMTACDPTQGMPTGCPAPRGSRGSAMPANLDEQQRQLSEAVGPRWWFALGLIVPTLVLLVCGKSLGGSIANAGGALLGLGALGILVMLLAMGVDYSDELMAVQQGAPGAPSGMQAQMAAQAGQVLKTKPAACLWASMVIYGLVCACGLADLMLPSMSPWQRRYAPAHPPEHVEPGVPL